MKKLAHAFMMALGVRPKDGNYHWYDYRHL